MTFEEALSEAKRMGTSKCSDAALMASICKHVLPVTVGAIAPKLVWEGAQRKGLKTRELVALAHRDAMAVDDLQWI